MRKLKTVFKETIILYLSIVLLFLFFITAMSLLALFFEISPTISIFDIWLTCFTGEWVLGIPNWKLHVVFFVFIFILMTFLEYD